jgi:Ca2+-binding RTX toxin-like protein
LPYSLRDTITDFNVGEDQLVLSGLLDSLGYSGNDPLGDRYLRLVQFGSSTRVQIDPDGPGSQRASNLIILTDVSATSLTNANFVF